MRTMMKFLSASGLIWFYLALLASPTWGQSTPGKEQLRPNRDEERRLKVLIAALGLNDTLTNLDKPLRACERLQALGPKAKGAVPSLMKIVATPLTGEWGIY